MFMALVGLYVAVVLVTGMKLHPFSSRRAGTIGAELFVLSAWCACYWKGPYPTQNVMEPNTNRPAAILLGSIGMIGTLGLKMGAELS